MRIAPLISATFISFKMLNVKKISKLTLVVDSRTLGATVREIISTHANVRAHPISGVDFSTSIAYIQFKN